MLQVIKYIAKLRLLEYGLVDAAKGVDDIHMKTKKSGDEEDVVDEQVGQFETRMNLYVYWHLQHSGSSYSGHIQDDLIYQTRKDVMTEFLRSTMLTRCQNVDCRA